MPTDLPVRSLPAERGQLGLIAALVGAGLAASGTEARRKIAEGAVRVDGQKVTDAALQLKVGGTYLLQLGPRRIARIEVVPSAPPEQPN